MRTILMVPVFALVAGACSVTEPDARWAVPEAIQYAEVLNVDLTAMNRTASGLYWQDLQEGTGATVAVGNYITVHYTGWLPDGTIFETTRPVGEPANPLRLGRNRPIGLGMLIRGWDEGIPGMKVGGRRKLVIRPELAYGRDGSPPAIPPLTTLIFEIEVVSID